MLARLASRAARLPEIAVYIALSSGALPAQTQSDAVKVLSVEPQKFTRGVPTILTAQIEVSLSSIDSGIVRVGFNNRRIDAFDLADDVVVALRGTHRVTLTFELIPVDWGARGQLRLFVAVGPRIDRNRGAWVPVATAKETLQVIP
ncbi:MAG: hypothetical protein P3B98_03745 [Gemmatimonadota bacterium]|nr:hypothetical protein [Gemmatimonadota bacterium]